MTWFRAHRHLLTPHNSTLYQTECCPMNHRTPPRLNVCFDPMTWCRMAPGPLTTPCPCSWSRCGAGASSWSPTQAPDQWIQQHHPRPPAVSRPPGCRVPASQPVTAPLLDQARPPRPPRPRDVVLLMSLVPWFRRSLCAVVGGAVW